MLTYLPSLYDRFSQWKPERRVERLTLYTAMAGFIIHLLFIYVVNHVPAFEYLASGRDRSYLAAIYTPFSILLFYEVFLLVVIIPSSTSAFVGKQFEIISLITLRSFFHDIADLNLSYSLTLQDPDFLKIGMDLGSALVMFGLTLTYYHFYPVAVAGESSLERDRFIQVKKMVAMVMLLLLLGMSVRSFAAWASDLLNHLSFKTEIPHPDSFFFGEFFNVMIFADVFLLIFSLLYKASFELLFRNACFVITTILLRYSLHGEKPTAYLIIFFAFLFSISAQILFQFSLRSRQAGRL